MTIFVDELIKNIQSLDREKITINDLHNIIYTKKDNEIYPNGIELNLESNTIVIDGKSSVLPKKQLLVIAYILQNPDRCIKRKELIENCWEKDVIVGERTIDVHICKVRKILKGKIIINTRKCFGYIWKTC
jgi:two-component system alkaline phosphatase synthesis response regulator PhoP